MTADELKVLKKIEKNLSSMNMRYQGPGPDKRDEVFTLLKQLIKGQVAQLDKKEFNRGYRAALASSRLAAEYLVHQLNEMKVPPQAWKGDE